MEKSHVTLEQKICSVCGKTYDTNSILLDRRLRPKFEMHTTTGYGLCPADQKKKDKGFVALVECDASKSTPDGNIMKPENAYRTGRVMHMKKKIFAGMFNVSGGTPPMAFIEQEAFDKIKANYEKAVA